MGKGEKKMSHVTKHSVKVSDLKLFCHIAKELGYQVGEKGTVRLYGSNIVKDAVPVHITGWNYPLAITADGAIHYDHFGSQHGTMEKFHELMMGYNEQVTIRNIPMDLVHNYWTATLEDGRRKLVLEYE